MRAKWLVWLKEKSPFILISFILGSILVLFLVVPIFSSVGSSASGLLGVLTDGRTLNAIWVSFYCAFLATVFILILGIPFAYLFVRHNFFGKNVLDSLIDIPILIPHNTAGIALLFVLQPDSPIGALFSMFGISFLDSVWGIIIAMAFVSAPFMVRSAQEAFLSIDPEMEKIGRSLGATKFKVFSNVTFEIISPPPKKGGIDSRCFSLP